MYEMISSRLSVATMIKTASKFKLSILLYMLDLSKSTPGDGEVTSLWEWNSMDAELVSETDRVFLSFRAEPLY